MCIRQVKEMPDPGWVYSWDKEEAKITVTFQLTIQYNLISCCRTAFVASMMDAVCMNGCLVYWYVRYKFAHINKLSNTSHDAIMIPNVGCQVDKWWYRWYDWFEVAVFVFRGELAQLVERVLCMHAWGRRFDSGILHEIIW